MKELNHFPTEWIRMLGIFSKITAALPLNTPHQIGIDIGASSVKFVAVRGSGTNIKVLAAGQEEILFGCMNDGVIADPRTIASAVLNAFKNSGLKSFKGVSAAVGIRGVGTIFRRLLLPLQSPEEMVNQITIEAQQQIESDLSDWIIDYQILTEPNRQGLVAVMLVGAKRSIVEDFLTVLKQVGVRPTIFDCDVFAISNTYERTIKNHGSQDTTICLDIGRDSTKFNLLQGRTPVIVRSFQIGGMHLTESIAKHMNLDFDQAEDLKLEGKPFPPSCEKAVSNHFSDLCKEIQQTITFFANSNGDIKIDSIDRILLSGGGAATYGLRETLENTLKTSVEFIDPFRATENTPQVDAETATMPHLFSVAFGLASRRMGDRES